VAAFDRIFEATTKDEVKEFIDWLLAYESYPFAVIFNWTTYEFRNKTDKLFFIVGMEAALEIGEYL